MNPHHPPLLPSLLDRLLDPDSLGPAGGGAALPAVVEAVRRDVEQVLNARRPADPELDGYPELGRSVFAFGVPELIARHVVTDADRAAVGRLLAEAIARHEPRLRDVTAAVVPDPGGADRTLRYRIAARLRLDPAPGLEFDTVLTLATGQAAAVAARP